MRSVTLDLSQCDREPIHIPGGIQPHGLLVAVDLVTLEVVQAAGDSRRLLGITPAELTGQTLQVALGAGLLQGTDHIGAGPMLPRPLLVSRALFAATPTDIVAYLSGGVLVLEIEPCADARDPNPLELVQGMVLRAESAADFGDLCQMIASEIQRATGYDRVMLYRFQADDSGHVVAESRRDSSVPSFLDLHYPASDIPAQARKLYLNNWLRYIPDATYTAQPLVPPCNPRTGAPLDMSFSTLRSVSPVHLEYLANMGVRSSMSLSLVVDGRLWGLVACHGAAPVFLTSRVRAGLELFAQLASLQLQNRLALEQTTARLAASEVRAGLVLRLSEGSLADGLLGAQPDLLGLIGASGVAVIAEGVITTKGLCPSHADLLALAEWLDATSRKGVYATDALSAVWRPCFDGDTEISGLLALSISRDPQDYVIWFLPELVSRVTWAGDGDKPVAGGADGARISPRKSFAAWRETVRHRSRPWSAIEIAAAGALRVDILVVVLRRLDQVAKEREAAAVRQQRLLAELDHRVKNSLATIQSMVRFSGRSAEDLQTFVKAIEQRLHAMAGVHKALTESRWEGVGLRRIIEAELAGHEPAGGPRVTLAGPEFTLEPKAALSTAMAIHELVTNAATYGSLSVAEGRLAIAWGIDRRAEPPCLAISWIETGGPDVQASRREGFGSLLLERVFGADLGGKASVAFLQSGLVCRLEIPTSRLVRVDDESPVPSGVEPPPSERLDGMRIMVVEDGALIAADVMDCLVARGASVVGPFFRLADARAGAQSDLDAALLDVDIDGEPVWELAADLRRRDIPIVLTNGFSSAGLLPAGFRDVPVVDKPYDPANLVSAIQSALATRSKKPAAGS